MTKQLIQLENLCLKILQSNYDNKAGLKYYPQYSDQIGNYNPVDVIVTIMRTYDFQFAKEFILSLPFLWTSLTTNDWIQIMERAIRRAPRYYDDDNADFMDIFVLTRYFQLDALTFYIKYTKCEKDVKQVVFRYFYVYRHLVCFDNLDLEYLDGEYLVEKSIVDLSASRLVREGKIKNIKLKEKHTEKYFKQLKCIIDGSSHPSP